MPARVRRLKVRTDRQGTLGRNDVFRLRGQDADLELVTRLLRAIALRIAFLEEDLLRRLNSSQSRSSFVRKSRWSCTRARLSV